MSKELDYFKAEVELKMTRACRSHLSASGILDVPAAVASMDSVLLDYMDQFPDSDPLFYRDIGAKAAQSMQEYGAARALLNAEKQLDELVPGDFGG